MKDIRLITSQLEPYIDFIFDHEADFLREFAEMGNPFLLANINFSNALLKYTYINQDGCHISDSITLGRFMEWINKMESGK